MERIDIKSMDMKELQSFIEAMGEKKFRAKQLYSWMHQKLVTDFDEMTNLSKAFRDRLKEKCSLGGVQIRREQISKKDGTRKFLMELSDGNMVETVLMKYHHGNSVCVSSQVGCRMGCRFCASTVGGLTRSLGNLGDLRSDLRD